MASYVLSFFESLIAYTLIAYDTRKTFWLPLIQSLPCICAYVALFARKLAYSHYVIAHAYNAANTHAQGSDWAVEAKKLVSSKIVQYKTGVSEFYGTGWMNITSLFDTDRWQYFCVCHFVIFHSITVIVSDFEQFHTKC